MSTKNHPPPSDAPKPARGRPRLFDRDAALEAAMGVFWRHGYEGASVDRLTAAMGITRSSLYQAFGDKEGLFFAALDHYGRTRVAPVLAALDGPGPLDAALGRFFAAAAALGAGQDAGAEGGGGAARGCLVSSVLGDSAGADPRMRAAFAERFEAVGAALAVRIARAQADGEVDAGMDAPALGAMFGALAHGLMLAARAGATPAAIERTAATARALLAGAPRAAA